MLKPLKLVQNKLVRDLEVDEEFYTIPPSCLVKKGPDQSMSHNFVKVKWAGETLQYFDSSPLLYVVYRLDNGNRLEVDSMNPAFQEEQE